MAPNDVNELNAYKVFKNLYGTIRSKKRVKFKFRVGDTVRISELKGQFQKGYLPGWSTELFIVTKRIMREPPVYKIKDLQDVTIDGVFYGYELIKFNKKDETYKIESIIKTRGKGVRKQYLVKWYNYPDKFNSWVNARDIKKLT
ncbi:uncharacterized protein LOC141904064 [Tubulanus polymorphus]|uniref:uncharacterized protein LOC141904064 n=1 Tax=Tubulanus polymorphus TaxID=672921 RepID=UPI003DA3AFE7